MGEWDIIESSHNGGWHIIEAEREINDLIADIYARLGMPQPSFILQDRGNS